MAKIKIVVVGGLVLLVLGVFLFMQKPKVLTEEGIPQGKVADIKETMADWFKDNTPTTCTFEIQQPGAQMVGTAYFIGENKLRADFTTTPETGEKVDSYSIRDNNTMYVWSSLSNMGTKFTINEDTATVPSDQNPTEVLKRPDVEYHCSPWLVDESKFVPPTDINFTDMNNQLKNLPTSGEGQTPEINCALCDQAPAGASRDQCREALNCP